MPLGLSTGGLNVGVRRWLFPDDEDAPGRGYLTSSVGELRKGLAKLIANFSLRFVRGIELWRLGLGQGSRQLDRPLDEGGCQRYRLESYRQALARNSATERLGRFFWRFITPCSGPQTFGHVDGVIEQVAI